MPGSTLYDRPTIDRCVKTQYTPLTGTTSILYHTGMEKIRVKITVNPDTWRAIRMKAVELNVPPGYLLECGYLALLPGLAKGTITIARPTEEGK